MLWRLERNHGLSEGSSEMTSVSKWIPKLFTFVSKVFDSLERRLFPTGATKLLAGTMGRVVHVQHTPVPSID